VSKAKFYDPQIRVLDCLGVFLFEVDPAAAREYEAGGAHARGNTKRVCSVVLTAEQTREIRSGETQTSGTIAAGQKFSHNRETERNPHGVWAFHQRSLLRFAGAGA
jgi:hypothetical protein